MRGFIAYAERNGDNQPVVFVVDLGTVSEAELSLPDYQDCHPQAEHIEVIEARTEGQAWRIAHQRFRIKPRTSITTRSSRTKRQDADLMPKTKHKIESLAGDLAGVRKRARELGLNWSTVKSRLYYGWGVEKALNTEVKK